MRMGHRWPTSAADYVDVEKACIVHAISWLRIPCFLKFLNNNFIAFRLEERRMIPGTMAAGTRSKSFVPMYQVHLALASCFEKMFLEHRQAKISLKPSHFCYTTTRVHTYIHTYTHTRTRSHFVALKVICTSTHTHTHMHIQNQWELFCVVPKCSTSARIHTCKHPLSLSLSHAHKHIHTQTW
jgi:hypothetical protein